MAARTANDGSEVEGTAGMTFTESLALCTSLATTGCLLCWWVIAGWSTPELDEMTRCLSEIWMMPGGRQAHPGHARLRGSVFPIREGGLHVFVSVFARLDVRSAVSDVQLQHYAVDAWVYLCLRSLNALAGAAAGLVPGRWTASELAAQRSVRAAVTRKLAADSIRAPLTLEGWQKELHGRQVGYTVKSCQRATS